MSRYLQKGDTVNDSRHNCRYEINSILGNGSSCVVYNVEKEGVSYLLKEFNPKFADISRDDNGNLFCSDERYKEAFTKGLEKFRTAYEKQCEFREKASIKNYTSPATDGFESNNTFYIAMVTYTGRNYSEIEETSLMQLLTRIQAIAKAIGYYHTEGYLHLDIKPENIFVLPETEKLPILFDFDSVTQKSDIWEKRVCSYTRNWAAPEQLSVNSLHKVSEATDLFAVCEILFFKLFGRHSKHYERRSFSKFEFDTAKGLLKNVNPKIFPVLTEIFNHTICNSAALRYRTAEELINKLNEAIALSDPRKPFLHHFPLSVKAFFVGRDNEFEQIEEELTKSDRLYISGIGGIGKSELAKQYAARHKDDYDAVIIAVYTMDIKSMICNIRIGNVPDYIPDEKQQDCVNRKLFALENISKDNKIFLIIDNFDDEFESEEDYELFEKLTSFAHKTIITTRNNSFENGRELKLNSVENVRQIFDNYYQKELNENDSIIIDQILGIYQNHTLATELLSKQMAAGRIEPKKMLEKLNSDGFKNSGSEKIKVGNISKQNAYSYIRSLFDVASLSHDDVYILLNLSLIPPTGISAETFYKWCGLDTYDNLNALSASGWINRDEAEDIIALHPVIADIMLDELENDSERCSNMLRAIKKTDVKESNLTWELLSKIINYLCDKINRLNNFSPTIIDFSHTAALAFYEFGELSVYLTLLNRAIEEFEKFKNDATVRLDQLHNALGIVYKANDQFDSAEKHYKIALSIADDLKCIIQISSNLASLYNNLERYKEAEEMCLTLIDKYSNEHNQKLRNIYDILGRINMAYCNYEIAEDYYKKAYESENSNSIDYHSLMGSLYDSLGRFSEAEKEFKIVFHVYSKHYGKKHRSTLLAYSNLISSYISQNKLDIAKEMILSSLNFYYETYGVDHTTTAIIINNLGNIYLAQKQYEAAEKYFKEALKIWTDKYASDHTRVAVAMLNLGVCYREQHKFDEAKQTLTQAQNVYFSIYKTENNEYIAASYSALGKTYTMCGEFDKAEECYGKALAIRKELLEDGHEKIKLIEERIAETEKLKNSNT